MSKISRTVWILSLISLFADIASEMLYPVMPLYLQSIQFSVVYIGVLEGVAEAVAGLSKGYFGKLSDNTGKRLPFVKWGYILSSLSKPMMAIFTWPAWIFLSRSLDRIGKGLRTGARDAMLSDEATPATKGRVFGFHRAMDTLGAAIGPVLALLFLLYLPGEYATLFYLAAIPGAITILLTFLLKAKNYKTTPNKQRTSLFSFVEYWRTSPRTYRKVVTGLLIFTLFNSSDIFLLLKIKSTGIDDTYAISIYIFYNLVYAAFALPIGIIADKIGFKNMLMAGLVLFAISYFGISYANNIFLFLVFFFCYGLYAAATEGIAKAWITNIASTGDKATAIGTYTAFQSVCTLAASTITGAIWYTYGATTALTIPAIAALVILIYFMTIKTKESH